MVVDMTIGRVLEIAIEREVEAVQFYVGLAARAKNPAMADLYHRLAEEEFRHKSRLEMEMLKEGLVVRNLGRIEEADDLDRGDELALPPDAEYKELVEMGIRKERKSFRLYARLAGLVADRETRDVLFQLAEEEARHMVQFEWEYDRLTAKEE